MVQWVGPRSDTYYRLIARTFQSVFPETTVWVNGTLLVGSTRPLRIDREAIARRFENPALRAALAGAGFADADAVLAAYTAGPSELREFLGEGPVLTDDKPMLEYYLSLPSRGPPGRSERPAVGRAFTSRFSAATFSSGDAGRAGGTIPVPDRARRRRAASRHESIALTIIKSWAGRHGFVRLASAPAARASDRSASCACALTATTGIDAVRGSDLQLPDGFPPVQPRHLEIHEDDVRPARPRAQQGVSAIGGGHDPIPCCARYCPYISRASSASSAIITSGALGAPRGSSRLAWMSLLLHLCLSPRTQGQQPLRVDFGQIVPEFVILTAGSTANRSAEFQNVAGSSVQSEVVNWEWSPSQLAEAVRSVRAGYLAVARVSAVTNFGSISTGTLVSLSRIVCTCGRTIAEPVDQVLGLRVAAFGLQGHDVARERRDRGVHLRLVDGERAVGADGERAGIQEVVHLHRNAAAVRLVDAEADRTEGGREKRRVHRPRDGGARRACDPRAVSTPRGRTRPLWLLRWRCRCPSAPAARWWRGRRP